MDVYVASLEEVINAVVRIESLGLSDTEGYQDIGVGTGFFINNNGSIVTNNHVVAGSQGIEVSINNSDLPLPATLIGTSECNDLAVIKINGTDYKYLKWYEGEITPGLEIFAAGYPLATKEYTLLDGIVSKKRAVGETNWASIEEVIEHTADILPGNSGGPLIDRNAKVLGVNYSADSYGQAFAITSNLAAPLIQTLSEGNNFLSIGINPEAFTFTDEDGTISGIEVLAVESNSIAFDAGIIAGDVIISLDNKEVGIDGLLTSYCNQLKNWDVYNPLPFEIFRPATGEFLSGELLGNKVESSSEFSAPIFDVDICPQSLKIGETYLFNFLVLEGAAPLSSLKITFTDSTGNFVKEYEPKDYLIPYEDEELGLVYVALIEEGPDRS